MTRAYVGLGGNSAPGARCLARAVLLLKKIPGARLTASSPVYASAPLGCPGRQREYCNSVVEMQTALPPRRLLQKLQQLEYRVQRRRRRRNAPRRLDLDYLLHGGVCLRSSALTLPHPRMLGRAFVLLPLADLAGKHYTGLRHAERLRAARRRCRGQILRRLS